MIYKLTSVKTVILQVVNDLGISDTEIPIDDFIEWIGKGLQHIGSYYQYTSKETVLQINNFKTELPCDFYKMQRMLYNDKYLSNNENIVSTNTVDMNNNRYSNSDINIIGNVIITSFQTGTINIQYLSIPVDCDGLPLVPDDVSFQDALFWRCAYQLSLRGFEFRNPQLKDILFTKKMWNIYCGQARANANMPDLDMCERLKNNYTRFVRKDEYINSFATLGQKEQLTLSGKNYFRNI